MQFYTATINSWKLLLADDSMKEIIVDTLRWLSINKRVDVHGFVIMPNHVHILWTILTEEPQHPETTFTSYTGHQFKKYLLGKKQLHTLNSYLSAQHDRQYHFWERRSLSKPVVSSEMAIQKLDYIHYNPVREKWRLAAIPEEYVYSSASYYLLNNSRFEFISHLNGYM